MLQYRCGVRGGTRVGEGIRLLQRLNTFSGYNGGLRSSILRGYNGGEGFSETTAPDASESERGTSGNPNGRVEFSTAMRGKHIGLLTA
jgi:hypothetical protein